MVSRKHASAGARRTEPLALYGAVSTVAWAILAHYKRRNATLVSTEKSIRRSTQRHMETHGGRRNARDTVDTSRDLAIVYPSQRETISACCVRAKSLVYSNLRKRSVDVSLNKFQDNASQRAWLIFILTT